MSMIIIHTVNYKKKNEKKVDTTQVIRGSSNFKMNNGIINEVKMCM
jgi:hypothetical protein